MVVIKYIIKLFWYLVAVAIMFPFASIFLFLSFFNHKFFWDKIWLGIICKFIEDNNLFPDEIYK